MASPEDWFAWWRRRQQRRAELQKEALPIISALREGDPKPLAAFLRSALAGSSDERVAIPRWVADEIACMIEGEPWCWYHLSANANKRGRSWSDDLATDKARWQVGYFTEKRFRELGRSGFEAAVAEAGARFGKRRTYVTEAHAMVRRYLASCDGLNAELGYQATDGWQVLSEVYSGESG